MSFPVRLDDSPLTIALDVRDPFAYLALSPAIAFGRELGVAIDWLPVRAQPLHPPSTPGPADDRGIRHRRHRAHMLAREIAVYAEAQGIVIREPYRDAPADAANLAWLWLRTQARDRLEPFLLELFRRYWSVALDVADRDAVAGVVDAAGADAPGFLAWARGEGPEALARLEAALREAGLHGSPAYLACNQVFLGRQHLPMIRWLLGGQQGPVPI